MKNCKPYLNYHCTDTAKPHLMCVSNARSHTSKAYPHPPEKTNNGRGKEIERKGRGEGCGQSQHKPAV